MDTMDKQTFDDETLTLYYYGDGLEAAERTQIESALRRDSALAARYKAISDALDQWQASEVAAPPHLVPQLQAALERAAQSERRNSTTKRSHFHFMSFLFGAGLAATLVLVIGIGLYLQPQRGGPAEVPMDMTTPVLASATFSRGLQSYLRDSRFELARLSVATPDEQALLILQIIDQNRLFETAAVQNGSQDVARVLRAFEPILLRMANSEIAPQDADALRAQLSFELGVMLTKLAKPASKDAQTI